VNVSWPLNWPLAVFDRLLSLEIVMAPPLVPW